MHPIREWHHYQERKIIDSVFPEKLTFDEIQFRTTRINESSEYMLLINSKIGGNKCGPNSSVLNLSLRVPLYKRESPDFILMYIQLLDISGLEIVKRIRENDRK